MLSIFEKIVPKPTSDDYKGCHYYIVSTIYTCFFDAATAYQVEVESIYNQWPTTAAGCCAVWAAQRCLNIKRETYHKCQSPEVLAYYKQVEDKYIENGCQRYAPKHYVCSNSVRLNGSIILILFIFSMTFILTNR
ncbi:hypothetical protein RDWZM_005116 [Blomia tropicalis]|uniref:Uncharacterized protein n=1 Tax=Blomia tropicalis TaxID=40697 RepID=A0A9Q0M5E9_BLOTA|nr:hypothetical protein RDWZM_005116 [Blomia tropicalis]